MAAAWETPLSRTTHHSRFARRYTAAVGSCCGLPGHWDDCSRVDATAGAVLGAYVDVQLTDLRFPARPNAAGRQILQEVHRHVTIRSYANAWPSWRDECCNQRERAERTRVRDELHRLTGLANTPCGCDEPCDALECTDLAAVAPTRHRRSSDWIVW